MSDTANVRVEVYIKVTKPDGFMSATPVLEASRTLIVDDDYRAIRRILSDAASDTLADAEDRIRHLARVREQAEVTP